MRNLSARYQLEDRSTRRGGAKRVGGRAGGHVEETLDLRGEAIDEGLDDFGFVGVGNLADHQGFRGGAAAQDDVACRARIASPCGLAAGGDQPSAALEVEHVDGSGEGLAGFSAADFEQAHVAGRKSEFERAAHQAVEEAVEGAFFLKRLGHDVAGLHGEHI